MENPPGVGTGWEPYPVSLRIVNWIKWFLAGNESEFGWQHSLAVQARWLRGRLEYHLLGNHLFANFKALVLAGLFFEGPEADQCAGLMANWMRLVQQYGFHRSSLLAVTNPTIAERIRTRYDCPQITVWSNGVDTQLFRPELRSRKIRADLGVEDDTLLVGYVGLHGRFQGLNAIVEAAGLLQAQNI